jgi:hypothetical protein
MGSNTAVDVVDLHAMFSPKHPTDLLILRIFLVTATRVAIKGEKRLFRVVNREAVLLQMFDDVCPSKITCDSHVDRNIDDIADLRAVVFACVSNIFWMIVFPIRLRSPASDIFFEKSLMIFTASFESMKILWFTSLVHTCIRYALLTSAPYLLECT